jgi:hypothetical protein
MLRNGIVPSACKPISIPQWPDCREWRQSQQPRPAIVAGRLGDIVANHGAAQGTTGVDDGLGDEGIVFEDLQCHDRPQKDRRPP